MSNSLAAILGLTGFAVMILSGLADLFLAITWAKPYLTSGVLLFTHHISIEERHTNLPPPSLLERKLSSIWISVFVFKELEANQYAFRRNFLRLDWNPILHGLVIFDAENGRVTVKGYSDWFMITFLILFFVLFPFLWLMDGTGFTDELWVLRTLGYVFGCGLIVGIPYLLDRDRLTKVATIAAELWSRKYIRGSERA